jgi:hypothetical protein
MTLFNAYQPGLRHCVHREALRSSLEIRKDALPRFASHLTNGESRSLGHRDSKGLENSLRSRYKWSTWKFARDLK